MLKAWSGARAKVATVWGVTLTEAAAFSKPKVARGMKRPASNHQAIDDTWLLDVCEDGDVRPHPGPLAACYWNIAQLNAGGLPGV